MSIRQDVLDLPRVKKARLTKAKERRLGDAVEEAVERLNCTRLPKIWDKRGRPPDLYVITVTGDVMRAMVKAGLPVTYWRSDNRDRVTTSLLIEIMNLVVRKAMIVQQARIDELNRKVERGEYEEERISAPGASYWRRVIEQASKLQRRRPIKLK